jgi:hypothetical protein
MASGGRGVGGFKVGERDGAGVLGVGCGVGGAAVLLGVVVLGVSVAPGAKVTPGGGGVAGKGVLVSWPGMVGAGAAGTGVHG